MADTQSHREPGNHWELAARVNTFWLPVLVTALCLLPALFTLRAAMPLGVQQSIYAMLLRYPSLGNLASVAFVVVLNLGIPMWAIACIANFGFICMKGPPVWQKVATTLIILVGIVGIHTVRSAILVIHQ